MAASVTVRRTFEVPGFARSNGFLYVDPFIRRSETFQAGGYVWSFYFNPVAVYDDLNERIITMDLRLETPGTTATVKLELGLLDPTSSRPVWKIWDTPEYMTLDSSDMYNRQIGVTLSRDWLHHTAPGPGFFTRGGLLFDCIVTILAAAPAPPTVMGSTAQPQPQPTNVAPSSDMALQLAKNRATGFGTDVTYSVKGVRFQAHRIILATRSPVFAAALYGGMAETTASFIEVKDMEAQVFDALLEYMYTDKLPDSTDGTGDAEYVTWVLRGLLVAADRYCMERLKVLCEQELCMAVSVQNVAEMLEFADDRHCIVLKDACIVFMVTERRMERVKKTEGYIKLRNTRPLILVEVLERSPKFQSV